MPTRSLAVTIPDDMLYLVSKALGTAGASVNRLIEAGIKAYQGQDRDAIIPEITNYKRGNLRAGGRKTAQIDERLLDGLRNETKYSDAARIGLYMLAYDVSRDDAERFLRNSPDWNVKIGRPSKKIEGDNDTA